MSIRTRKPSVLHGVLVGAMAGIAATLLMDQFQKLSAASQKTVMRQKKLAEGESPWTIAHEQALEEQKAAAQEGSTEIVARHIAEATHTQIPEDKKKQAGMAVHYTFGTLMGVAYGVATEFVPEVASGGGTAFGTMLFLGADAVAVPALHLAPPPTETAPVDHLQHWAAHVVYGGALEMVRGLLNRIR